MSQFFAVSSEKRKFKHSREAEFREALEDIHNHTLFEPIDSVREVTLDSQGRTLTGGFKLTTWAFYQLCNATCPGMYRFVVELAGNNRTSQARSDFSYDDALEVLNRVICRRFETRLFGRQMIRNTKTNTIEGIVGRKYRWLPNLDLYTHIREILDTEHSDAKFYEAVLNGRWMLLRFYKRNSSFSIPVPENFHGDDRFFNGFHFSNSEVGQSSAKAGLMILREMSRTAAISPLVSGGRLRHAGKDFNRRLAMMIAGVAQRIAEPELHAAQLQILQAMPLGLGRTDLGEEEEQRELLMLALTRRRMNPGLAKRIVTSTMCYGSYEDSKAGMDEVPGEVMKAKSAFDLYNAIGREAKRMSINIREQAEQCAYALLLNRLKLPQETLV